MEKNNQNNPSRWEFVPLSQIAEINPRIQKGTINSSLQVSFVPMKCVEELSGQMDLSNSRKYEEVKNGFTYFANEDILFAKITPCMENGKIAIAKNLKNGIGFGSTEFHVVRILDEEIPREFYFWYLMQDKFRNNAQHNMKGTAGQLRVPVSFIENSMLPVPPLNEQKRIVVKIEELFSKLDKNIDDFKKIKIQLQKYRQSVLDYAFSGKLTGDWRRKNRNRLASSDDLFKKITEEKKNYTKGKLKEFPLDTSELPQLPEGWIWIRLDMVCSKITDGTHFSPPNKKDGKYPYITAKNIKPWGMDISNLTFVSEEVHSEIYARCNPEKGDVLYIKDGATTGLAVVNELDREFSMLSSVALLKPMKNILDSYYLKNFLNNPQTFQRLTGRMSGTAIRRLILERIREAEIAIPSILEQEEIVNCIHNIISVVENMEKIIEQNIIQSNFLRQSILKSAFEGKLVPQDPTDESASILLEKIKQKKNNIKKD